MIVHRVIVRSVIVTERAPRGGALRRRSRAGAAAPAPAPAPSAPAAPAPARAGARTGARRARHHGVVVNELVFPCMGTTVRLIADAPLEPVRAGIEEIAARLTRFDPASELCALNADPRDVVPASPLLRRAVQAALLGARRTGGLADPTLLDAVEAAGYARVARSAWSRRPSMPPCAPPRRGAPATPGRRWREVEVGAATASPARPACELDLGGSAKGLAADWAASRLARPLRRRLRRRRARRRDPRRRAARHRPHAAGHRRRGGHVGHRPPRVAADGRLLRPPPARPRHGRARVDRRDLRHRHSPTPRSRPRRSRRPRCWPAPSARAASWPRAEGSSSMTTGGATASAAPPRGRAGGAHDARPDGLRLVAGLPRVGPRRARADHALASASGSRWPGGRSRSPASRAR